MTASRVQSSPDNTFMVLVAYFLSFKASVPIYCKFVRNEQPAQSSKFLNLCYTKETNLGFEQWKGE